jgi:regulator of sigma E protease
MNLIFAVLLFTVAEAIGQVEFRPVVAKVTAGSPAAQAGIQPGDTIIAVDGQSIKYFSDLQQRTAQDIAQAGADAKTVPVQLEIQRSGTSEPLTLTVNAITHPGKDQGPMGVEADTNNPYHLRPPLWQAPMLGVQDIGKVTVATVQGVQAIIRGIIPLNQAVQGPVGIVTTTGQFASEVPNVGLYPVVFLAAFLSLNLAIVNLLPIPGLDGGRLLLIGVEVLRRGKRLSPEREGLVNLIGLGALLFLVLLVTINDVGNLVH